MRRSRGLPTRTIGEQSWEDDARFGGGRVSGAGRTGLRERGKEKGPSCWALEQGGKKASLQQEGLAFFS
jgi:hypothetical protein